MGRWVPKKEQEWGVQQRDNLVKLIELNGGNITEHVKDLLLYKINGLRVNDEGKLYYLSDYKECDRVSRVIKRYRKLIQENLDVIYSPTFDYKKPHRVAQAL
jgi:hypothetical protein